MRFGVWDTNLLRISTTIRFAFISTYWRKALKKDFSSHSSKQLMSALSYYFHSQLDLLG